MEEAAFQNLRNYDENPRRIRLPEDQNPEVLAETEKEQPGDNNASDQRAQTDVKPHPWPSEVRFLKRFVVS